MKRIYQMAHSYTFDTGRGSPGEHTERSSFSSLEKAIANAEWWIAKTEPWMDTTVTHIEVINKETGNLEWSYKA